MTKINEEEYLGDGLYVKYDGFSLELRAPREVGDHYVSLEPAVFAAFMRFVEDNTEIVDGSLIEARRSAADWQKKADQVSIEYGNRYRAAEAKLEASEGKIKTLASALVKFAPDIAAMISERWIKANKDADEALKQFIEVLREAK